MQSLRFYLVFSSQFASGALFSYISVNVVPMIIVAILTIERRTIGITFLWVFASIIGLTLLNTISLYVGERLALDWRKSLTRKVRPPCTLRASPAVSNVFHVNLACHQAHFAYFNGKCMYWLNQVDRRVDNADQRIAEE
jgi:hypothetical protein